MITHRRRPRKTVHHSPSRVLRVFDPPVIKRPPDAASRSVSYHLMSMGRNSEPRDVFCHQVYPRAPEVQGLLFRAKYILAGASECDKRLTRGRLRLSFHFHLDSTQFNCKRDSPSLTRLVQNTQAAVLSYSTWQAYLPLTSSSSFRPSSQTYPQAQPAISAQPPHRSSQIRSNIPSPSGRRRKQRHRRAHSGARSQRRIAPQDDRRRGGRGDDGAKGRARGGVARHGDRVAAYTAKTPSSPIESVGDGACERGGGGGYEDNGDEEGDFHRGWVVGEHGPRGGP
ncbi:hypothetical protein OF83DRAFT_12562 [Amylostereum chailletii]|nr:hypothetical protein OF83DRAFT_12562 [Amylostereum chailletii]